MTTDEHSELSKELEEFQSSIPHAALFSDLEVLPGGEGFRFMGTRILGALSMEPVPPAAPLSFISCALENDRFLMIAAMASDRDSPDFYRLVASLPFEPDDSDSDSSDPAEALALRAERIDRLSRCLAAADALSDRLPLDLLHDARTRLLHEIRALCSTDHLKARLSGVPVASVSFGPRCIRASSLPQDEAKGQREPIQFVSPCFSGLAEGRPVMLIRTTMSDERKALLWIRDEEDFHMLSSRFMGWKEDEREAWCRGMRSRLEQGARSLTAPRQAPLEKLALHLCEHAESLFDLMPDEPQSSFSSQRQILRGEAAPEAWDAALDGVFTLFAAVDETVRNKLGTSEEQPSSSSL